MGGVMKVDGVVAGRQPGEKPEKVCELPCTIAPGRSCLAQWGEAALHNSLLLFVCSCIYSTPGRVSELV